MKNLLIWGGGVGRKKALTVKNKKKMERKALKSEKKMFQLAGGFISRLGMFRCDIKEYFGFNAERHIDPGPESLFCW